MRYLRKKETIFIVLTVLAQICMLVALFYQELGHQVIIVKDLWVYILCLGGAFAFISFFYSAKIHFLKKQGFC